MRYLTIRNENIIRELLNSSLTLEKISVAKNSAEESHIKKILNLGYKRGVDIERKPRHQMPRGRSDEAYESITATLRAPGLLSFEELLKRTEAYDETPFFLLANRVDYTANLSFISRTAFAAGVYGIIFQGKEEFILNDETLHLSMGAMARIPLVKMNIFTAIKKCAKNNIRTFALRMDGKTYFETDLKGPAAFVLGNESEGVSDNVSDRCDGAISIPMREGIDSLNVSSSAAVIMYEKIRQDLQG